MMLIRRVSPAVRVLAICCLLWGINSSGILAQTTWSLPAPWSAQDIGGPPIAGDSSFDQGTFTVDASGADIWGQSDQFHFVYQQVSGDVDVIARVDSVSMTDAWAKAGVMIRSSLAADAAHGSAFVTAGNGVAFQRRTADGGASAYTAGPDVAAPAWVRLVRTGTKVTAYSSADGRTWATIGSTTIALAGDAYVGLAVTSHNTAAATTAALSQVSVVPLSLPASQHAVDIGSPAIEGSVTYRQGVYTHHAAGTDIWGSTDQFNFVYQAVSGDVEIVARVASIANTSNRAKSGVMIREDLTPGSRHAFALATPRRGMAFERRTDPGGLSVRTTGPSAALPEWVRLVRTGSQIEAFSSSDGVTWTSIGSDAIPMADSVYVGIATTSHNARAATDAVLDHLTITQAGAATNQPPLVTLTAPTDGSTFTVGTDISLTAAASDADGTIGQVNFFAGSTPIGSATTNPYSVTWSPSAPGTYSLTAVATDNGGATTSSAAISVKVDATPNNPPTVTLTAPSAGATYTAPAAVVLSASASDPENALDRVEFYSGATLIGTATSAPYSLTWSSVAAGTYSVRAVAYDAAGASATSATNSITVNAPNAPPTVTLTGPANGATYTAPATVVFSANASDPENAVTRVEFYSGSTLIGTDASAPYSFSWGSVPAGTYTVRAVAYDAAGASASSAAVTIIVTTPVVTPPTAVAFTASVDHTSVTSYELRIYAIGANPANATAIATSDLGKPTPDANGDITVDRATFFGNLAVGDYVAAVAAIGTGGASVSTGVTFTR